MRIFLDESFDLRARYMCLGALFRELYRILYSPFRHSRHSVIPSFPRKRESLMSGNGKAAIGMGALDSRESGNDYMGKNDGGEEDV